MKPRNKRIDVRRMRQLELPVVFACTLVVSALVVASLRGISLISDAVEILPIAVGTGMLSLLLTRYHGPSSGITGGVIAALVVSALPQSESGQPLQAIVMLAAIAIGAWVERLIPVLGASVLTAGIAYLIGGLALSASTVFAVFASWAVRAILSRTLQHLPYPLSGLGKEAPYLLAFGTGYLITVLLFALLYHNAYILRPSDAFAIPEGTNSSYGLWYFIFVSLRVMTTVGSPLEPNCGVTQALMSAQLIASVSWIVIYFGLLIHSFGKQNPAHPGGD